MAKTAPDAFVPVPTGAFLPLEYVVEGDTAAKRGQEDVVKNVNHVVRSVTPTVIMQPMKTATHYYVTTVAQSPRTAMIDRMCWRIPTVAGIHATPLLRFALWAETGGAGQTGTVRLYTGAQTTDVAVTHNAGVWKEYTGTVQYSTAAAYDLLTLALQSGDAAYEVAVKSLTVWVDVGDNPSPGGYDVEPYASDVPLASYMPNLLSTKLTDVAEDRPGVVVSYAEDSEDISVGVSVGAWFQQSAAANTTVDFLRGIPVTFGPRTTALRIHLNGFAGANSYIQLWTDYSKRDGGADISLPLAGAWTFSGSFATDTVALRSSGSANYGRKGSTMLHLGAFIAAGEAVCITNLSVWEEPI